MNKIIATFEAELCSLKPSPNHVIPPSVNTWVWDAMDAPKHAQVESIFETIPPYYDFMNDVMSLGMHRAWKAWAIAWLGPIPEDAAYADLACGSGDIAALLHQAQRLPQTRLLIDPSHAMLKRAHRRLPDSDPICAHAEHLPLADASLHTVTMAFGLRNTYDPPQALRECYRVLEPGGQLLLVEFHRPQGPFQAVLEGYLQCLPYLGEWITGDRSSYAYLSESIQHHAPPEAVLSSLAACGFHTEHARWLDGLVVVYHALKGMPDAE